MFKFILKILFSNKNPFLGFIHDLKDFQLILKVE